MWLYETFQKILRQPRKKLPESRFHSMAIAFRAHSFSHSFVPPTFPLDIFGQDYVPQQSSISPLFCFYKYDFLFNLMEKEKGTPPCAVRSGKIAAEILLTTKACLCCTKEVKASSVNLFMSSKYYSCLLLVWGNRQCWQHCFCHFVKTADAKQTG